MSQFSERLRKSRARRVHARARAGNRNRLVVFRSNRAIYAQIVDDSTGKIVCGASALKSDKTGIEAAVEVGVKIAELAKKQKISAVSFDRNGYRYHGQVKSLADAAREAGLNF